MTAPEDGGLLLPGVQAQSVESMKTGCGHFLIFLQTE